jgi:hypothetical protein
MRTFKVPIWALALFMTVPGLLWAQGPAAVQPPESQSNGLEPESLPAEILEDQPDFLLERSLGPTPVSDVGLLKGFLDRWELFESSGLRSFGWVEGGYTGASTGAGLLSVQTRQNRYGDEFLLNQIGLVLQKPLRADVFNLGFNIRYFAGADAALGQPCAATAR